MAEYPSPSSRLQSFFGPSSGHELAMPLLLALKSWAGPPHWVHESAESPRDPFPYPRAPRAPSV